MRVREVSAGPLFGDDGPFWPRLLRRVRGIAIELIAFVVVTLLFPVLLLVAAAVDLTLWLRRRKHWMGVRLVAMAWWFLFGEMQALVALIAIWLGSGGPWGRGSLTRARGIYNLRLHWSSSHLAGIRVLCGLRFEVEGLEEAGPGPAILLIRHASIIDNLLPDSTVGRRHGIGIRFVIKRELQALPTIDIGGRWAPTYYVRRGSSDAAGEIAALSTLAHNVGRDEVVAIYPEGTRPTPAKLARAQEIIAERQPELVPMASRLRHVLPPRLGGPLGLLEEGSGLDVIVCGHHGFDGFQYVSDIWAGGLVGRTIRVRFWRYPAASIPDGEEARTRWLYERWQELDDWVGEQMGVRAEPAQAIAGPG